MKNKKANQFSPTLRKIYPRTTTSSTIASSQTRSGFITSKQSPNSSSSKHTQLSGNLLKNIQSPNQTRCPICTLKLPCKHQQTNPLSLSFRLASKRHPRVLSANSTRSKLKQNLSKLRAAQKKLLTLQKIQAFKQKKIEQKIEQIQLNELIQSKKAKKQKLKELYRQKYMRGQKLKLQKAKAETSFKHSPKQPKSKLQKPKKPTSRVISSKRTQIDTLVNSSLQALKLTFQIGFDLEQTTRSTQY